MPSPCSSDIDFFRIPVYDSLMEKDLELMTYYFSIVIPYLLQQYSKGKNILIHCYAGKQRSAIVIASFLKILTTLEYDIQELSNFSSLTDGEIYQFKQIIKYINKKRPQAFTYGYRINFEKSYKKFFKLFKYI